MRVRACACPHTLSHITSLRQYKIGSDVGCPLKSEKIKSVYNPSVCLTYFLH